MVTTLRVIYTISEMPSEKVVAEVASMMSDLEYKVNDVRELERKVTKLLEVQTRTLDAVKETITLLNKKHLNVNIAKGM